MLTGIMVLALPQLPNYIYDATSGGEGVLWTVSYNYGYLVKWELNAAKTQWVCENYLDDRYFFDMAGVDIDEQSGKMYLYGYAYENLYPNYNRMLYEINPTSSIGTLMVRGIGFFQ